MICPVTRGSAGKAGFALPVVLVTLAILTMIFLTIVLAMDDSAGQTLARLRQADFELKALSSEAEFSYFATTEPLGPQSIKIGGQRSISIDDVVDQRQAANLSILDLQIDGAAYGWESSTLGMTRPLILTVQDEAGLFNLSFAALDALNRLFLASGYDGERATKAASRTMDFIDADDLIALNGAEAPDYKRSGLVAPLNMRLRSPDQLNGLLGHCRDETRGGSEQADSDRAARTGWEILHLSQWTLCLYGSRSGPWVEI